MAQNPASDQNKARLKLLDDLAAIAARYINEQFSDCIPDIATALEEAPADPRVGAMAADHVRANGYALAYGVTDKATQRLRKETRSLMPRKKKVQAPGMLSLVPMEEMDSKLVFDTVGRPFEARYSDDLATLNVRLATALDRDVLRTPQNPFRPDVLLGSIYDAWCEFAPDEAMHPLLMPLLKPDLMFDLKPMYQELVAALQRTRKEQAQVETVDEAAKAAQLAAQEAERAKVEADLNERLRALLGGTMKAPEPQAEPAPAPAPAADAPLDVPVIPDIGSIKVAGHAWAPSGRAQPAEPRAQAEPVDGSAGDQATGAAPAGALAGAPSADPVFEPAAPPATAHAFPHAGAPSTAPVFPPSGAPAAPVFPASGAPAAPVFPASGAPAAPVFPASGAPAVPLYPPSAAPAGAGFPPVFMPADGASAYAPSGAPAGHAHLEAAPAGQPPTSGQPGAVAVPGAPVAVPAATPAVTPSSAGGEAAFAPSGVPAAVAPAPLALLDYLRGVAVPALASAAALQHGAADGGAPGAMPALPTNLLGLKQSLPPGALSPADENTIDLLVKVFDAAVHSGEVTDEVRELIDQLQIPVLKSALQDKKFFFEEGHPARRLLDLMSSVAWEIRPTPEDPLMRAVQRNVERVGRTVDREPGVFAEAVADLETAIRHEEEAAEEAIAAPVAAALRHEKIALSVKSARAAVTLRINGGGLPPEVVRFLNEKWATVMTLAHSVEDDKPGMVEFAARAMDDLVWSVRPKATHEQRKQLVGSLPGLLKRLNKWLDAIKWTDESRPRFLAELAQIHASIVRAPIDNSPERQLELAEAAAQEEALRRQRLEQAAEAQAQAEHAEPGALAAEALPNGAVLDFIEADGKRRRARLAWTSPRHTLYVFSTNGRQETFSLTGEKLAGLLRSGRAERVEQAGVVGRALSDALAGGASPE